MASAGNIGQYGQEQVPQLLPAFLCSGDDRAGPYLLYGGSDEVLYAMFLLMLITLMIVPFVLIANGILIMKREGPCAYHCAF